MNTPLPSRGEAWMTDFGLTVGHEQAGRRPALAVSVDAFNQGQAGLAVVLPITSKAKGIPLHVEVNPPDGGLAYRSFVKCDNIRSVSVQRLSHALGYVSQPVLAVVGDRLRKLLGL
jgi:mRNA interferase MazF